MVQIFIFEPRFVKAFMSVVIVIIPQPCGTLTYRSQSYYQGKHIRLATLGLMLLVDSFGGRTTSTLVTETLSLSKL